MEGGCCCAREERSHVMVKVATEPITAPVTTKTVVAVVDRDDGEGEHEVMAMMIMMMIHFLVVWME